MIHLITEIVCLFLFATGLLFIFIELRAKYERSFLYFGISTIILCLFASIDIWILPKCNNIVESEIFWTKIQHLILLCFTPFLYVYIKSLVKDKISNFIKILIFVEAPLAILLFSNLLLKNLNGKMEQTPLYYMTFISVAVIFMLSLAYIIIKEIKTSSVVNKKILYLNLIGLFFLLLCGILDSLALSIIGNNKGIPSFMVFGILVYGITATMVFTERFIGILKDKDSTLKKLEEAYFELESVSTLKQLGESTAIINHEIKNYTCMISGTAQLIRDREPLSEVANKRINQIINSVTKLSNFSQEILDLTRSKVIHNKEIIPITSLIKTIARDHFPKYANNIKFADMDENAQIYGNWSKLEHVFTNLIKNSIDASSAEPLEICIRTISDQSVLLIIIDDNGTGCNTEQLQGMFKAFFTTKKGRDGTGLGLSLTKSIIEGHGGRISAYSKNLENCGSKHGLTMQMAFPIYKKDSTDQETDNRSFILVKDGIENIELYLNIFANVKCKPRIVEKYIEALDIIPQNIGLSILGNVNNIGELNKRKLKNNRLFITTLHNSLPFAMQLDANSEPLPLTEEFVVTKLQKAF